MLKIIRPHFTIEEVLATRLGQKTRFTRLFFAEIGTDVSSVIYGKGFPPECRAWEGETTEDGSWPLATPMAADYDAFRIACPYSTPRARTFVRETLREDGRGGWRYAADGMPVELPQGDPRIPEMLSWAHHFEDDWCSPAKMPRFAARLHLEITEVRWGFLDQITDEDAHAEGFHNRASFLAHWFAVSRPEIPLDSVASAHVRVWTVHFKLAEPR